MWKGIGLVALTLAFEGAFLLQVALPSGLGGDASERFDRAVVIRPASQPVRGAPIVPAIAPPHAPPSPCPATATGTRS
jgi:hypothetical protein